MDVVKLRLEYVPLSTAVEWDWVDNAKLHDIGGIIQSIQEHGFRDPPEFDATLGAFAQGNGRVKALWMLAGEMAAERPRYIRETEGGEWAVPVLFGADSKSVAAAQAYAIDANNLTLTGGDTELWDLLALYDRDQLAETIEAIGEQGLITLDGDCMDIATAEPEGTRWSFRVDFDGETELLEELEDLMGPYFMPRSRRKLMPEFFTAMVRSYCTDGVVPVLLE